MKLASLTDLEFQSTLSNFSNKIGGYGTTLNVTLAQVATVNADNTFFNYVINMQNQVKNQGKDWTTYKNILRSTTKAVSLGDAPIWAPPVAPATAAANISGRWSKLIQQIKSQPNYTEAIGDDLGISAISSALTQADIDALKPKLKAHLVAGQPIVEWKKGDADGINIYGADGNTGIYVFLATNLHPNYLDKRPLPAPGQSAVRKFKAVYIMGDEEVGQYSDEISISVMG
jgi:hypothetical protein